MKLKALTTTSDLILYPFIINSRGKDVPGLQHQHLSRRGRRHKRRTSIGWIGVISWALTLTVLVSSPLAEPFLTRVTLFTTARRSRLVWNASYAFGPKPSSLSKQVINTIIFILPKGCNFRRGQWIRRKIQNTWEYKGDCQIWWFAWETNVKVCADICNWFNNDNKIIPL